MENRTSEPTRESCDEIRTEILVRIERLAKTALNGKNFIKVVNEHAISPINYYVGMLKLEPEDFKAIDHDIRQLLIKYKVHKQSACLERLDQPRDELGFGLRNVDTLCSCRYRTHLYTRADFEAG
ncbi:unnamed protein product [Thelazia callipaeda]|uniref:Late expression factor 11 n=1 Tax=Thelazia callipaeda TaxID=103827 RepID=A0A0N5D1M1_THECL|nr:unnamed protein product [Thelazia callipaeda]